MDSLKFETFVEETYEPKEENNSDPTIVNWIVKENPYIRILSKTLNYMSFTIRMQSKLLYLSTISSMNKIS